MPALATLYWVNAPASLHATVFELRTTDRKLMSLVYNEATHTVKFEATGNRRTFHVEKEGLLKNKTTIFNEYGVMMGYLLPDIFSHTDGKLVLNEDHFHYSISHGSNTTIKLYANGNRRLLFSCSLTQNNDTTAIHFADAVTLEQNPGLITVLSWLLFIPVAAVVKSNHHLA
jgi:hypothetical protein